MRNKNNKKKNKKNKEKSTESYVKKEFRLINHLNRIIEKEVKFVLYICLKKK